MRRIIAAARLAALALLVAAAPGAAWPGNSFVATWPGSSFVASAAAEPRGWRPDVAAARAYAERRAGEVAFAVRTRSRSWEHRATTQYRSASIVKAMLLVAYLRRPDVRGRALRADERALLEPMVRASDNRAADAIHARVGVTGLAALARRAGLRAFVPHVVWGGSLITAADQARFFLRVDRLVPRRHRADAMGLLRSVVGGQRWGLPQALPPGWTIAFKGGWGRGVTRQVTHQAALLRREDQRVAVAVLTADNPSTRYGAETIRGVAARLLRGLEGRLVGRVLPPPQRRR